MLAGAGFVFLVFSFSGVVAGVFGADYDFKASYDWGADCDFKASYDWGADDVTELYWDTGHDSNASYDWGAEHYWDTDEYRQRRVRSAPCRRSTETALHAGLLPRPGYEYIQRFRTGSTHG